MPNAGLRTVIFLSFFLSIGFILVILSCALYSNWLPLIVVGIYMFAPVPNALANALKSTDDIIADTNSSFFVDFSKFFTGFLIVSGIAIPILLAHSGVIQTGALVMSVIGGLIIHSVLISYTHFFRTDTDF